MSIKKSSVFASGMVSGALYVIAAVAMFSSLTMTARADQVGILMVSLVFNVAATLITFEGINKEN